MSHPFELELSDLEAVEISFEEQLTSEDAGKVHGGFLASPPIATTEAVGEEGGGATTYAVGEEGGGGFHPPSETLTAVRWGESGEGGGGPTTYYITARKGEAGEEGGGYYL